MIRKPPELPKFENLDPELERYLREVNEFHEEVYNKLRYLDLGELGIYAGTAVPAASLGQDGDLYVRVNGASSSLYQNINGTWTINS